MDQTESGMPVKETAPSRHSGPFTVGKRFAYAIVLLVPVSFMVVVFRNETALAIFKLPLAGAAISIALVVLLIHMLRSRSCAPLTVCTAPLAAFGAVSVLSVLDAGVEPGSVTELLQMLVQFIGGYIVLVYGIGSEGRLRTVLRLITIVAAAVIAYGLVQYAIVGSKHHLVSSAFDNRNVLGGYLALVLPVLFGLLLSGASAGGRFLYGAVIVCGLLVITSITSFLSILVAFVLTVLLRGRDRALIVPTVALFAIVAVVPLGVRLSDLAGIGHSLHEPRGIERYHGILRRNIEMFHYPLIGSVRAGRYGVIVSSAVVTPRSVPDDFVMRQMNARKKDASYGDGGHLHQRMLEWQAGLNVLRDKPLFGVGVGNYQREISRYYFSLPKLNTMEPDSQSGYLVTLFTTGLMGLAAFAWILFTAIERALRNANGSRDPFMTGLSWGTVCGMVAFTINTMFSPLIYQTTAVQFIVLLSIIGVSESILGRRGER